MAGNPTMPYERLDDASYTDLRRRLLTGQASVRTSFLTALCDRGHFLAWMQAEVETVAGDRLPVSPDPLTEAEFKRMPTDTEQRLFDTWRALTPADACRPTFWACVTRRHIEEGRIEASYLAANRGPGASGRERIARALRDGNEHDVNGVIRTALRQLSGLPERGHRSVFVNCPFARAWWRQSVANEVDDATGQRADRRRVLSVLSRSQEYWEKLINFVVSRNSVLGDTNVRSALIWALAERPGADDRAPDDPTRSLSGLQRITQQIGIRSAWQELGVFEVDEIKALMEREFLSAAAPYRTPPPTVIPT